MPTEPAQPLAEPRVAVLDGLRGMAILGVMLHHMTVISARTPVEQAFKATTTLTGFGVDLFFVLSGFLITGILWDTRGGQGYFRTFYARRVLRIFPLYYAVVFVSLVVLPRLPFERAQSFGGIAGDEWYYWSYLSNFAIAKAAAFRHAILDISWSLAIEEQFYLIWPIAVLLLSRRALMRLCVVLAAAALGARVRMLALMDPPASPITVYVLTWCRMDPLAIGALVALASREEGSWRAFVRVARPLAFVAGLGALGLIMADAFVLTKPSPEVSTSTAFMTVGLTLVALFCGALLVMTLDAQPQTWLARAAAWRPLRVLGLYSYAIYLFHLPMRAVVRDALFGPVGGKGHPRVLFPDVLGSQLPAQAVFMALCLPPIVLAAWLSWNLYEKQFLKLKRYFPYSRGAVVARSDGPFDQRGRSNQP